MINTVELDSISINIVETDHSIGIKIYCYLNNYYVNIVNWVKESNLLFTPNFQKLLSATLSPIKKDKAR